MNGRRQDFRKLFTPLLFKKLFFSPFPFYFPRLYLGTSDQLSDIFLNCPTKTILNSLILKLLKTSFLNACKVCSFRNYLRFQCIFLSLYFTHHIYQCRCTYIYSFTFTCMRPMSAHMLTHILKKKVILFISFTYNERVLRNT